MNICVFCASRDNLDPAYEMAAAELGRQMANENHTLIYGGGMVGLMGVVARATHEGGGRVVGVIPKRLRTREIAYEGADELIETATMTERKEVMIHRSDAFVVLPGGFGTLDELIETVTLYHLGYHNKPTILINVAGFFDPVLALFEHFYATNVAYPRYAEAYHVVQTPGEALSLLGA